MKPNKNKTQKKNYPITREMMQDVFGFFDEGLYQTIIDDYSEGKIKAELVHYFKTESKKKHNIASEHENNTDIKK